MDSQGTNASFIRVEEMAQKIHNETEDEPSKSTYHIEDGLQYKVYVDRGETRPVVDRSNPAVVFPEERPGQLVQS